MIVAIHSVISIWYQYIQISFYQFLLLSSCSLLTLILIFCINIRTIILINTVHLYM